MNIALTLFVLLLAGLGLFSAWLLWFMRREVSRLDARLDESLDDQDLIEFQERLEGLLREASSTGERLTQLTELRRKELEKALAQVREAEEALGKRARLLEKAADAAARRSEALERLPEAMAMAKALPGLKAALAPEAELPAAKPEPPAAQAPVASPQPEALAAPKSPADPAPAQGYNAAGPAGAKRYQQVLTLSDQGQGRDEIARQTGLLAGEVDLILNLRRPQESPRA